MAFSALARASNPPDRLLRRRRLRLEDVAQTDQVVSDHVQAKYTTDVFFAAHLELAQAAEFLDPAKNLLDAPAGID
jgi:hypothetical protein